MATFPSLLSRPNTPMSKPEMFVPQRPGTIVPINPLDRHVNRLNARGDKQLTDNADHYSGLEKDYAGMAKDYQGLMLSYQETRGQHKPGTPEYEAANKSQNEMYDQFVDKVQTQEQYARDAAKNRGLIGTGQGWKDHVTTDEWSQRRAEAAMEAMRERSKATPGSPRFTGPMMPPAGGGQPQMPQPPSTRLQQAQQQNAIAGQNQRELAAKFNPPVPQGMPTPMGADPRRSGPLSGRGQFGPQSGPLSMRGPMPVGRSANDPNRIAEQMRRRGDPRAIMQMGMQQQGMDFARERDATNFQQGLMMNGMQQAAMAQRDATNFQQSLAMQGMQQGAMDQRDATNFQQQMMMNEQQRQMQQQDEAQRRQFGLKPVPVTGTSTPFYQDAKGSIHAGGEMPRPEAPLPPGMVPQSAERGGVRYGAPAVEKPVAVKAPTLKQIYEGDVPQNVQWNEQRNRWERVKIYNPGDPDDNGVPGDQRSGAATTTTTAKPPSKFLERFQ